MNQFAAYLLEAFIAEILAERDDLLTRAVVRTVRQRFEDDPRTMTRPIRTALEKSGKMLVDKAWGSINLETLRNEIEKSLGYETRLAPSKPGYNPLFEVNVKGKLMAATPPPVGHPINHLDEPGACLAVLIDSTQELPARVCAGLDLSHWGVRTFLPHTEPKASADLSAKTEAELCAMIAPPTEGVGAPDWKAWWEFIKPIVAELIRRWLFS